MFANSNFYIYAMLLLRCADLFLHSRPKAYLAHAKDLRQISVKNWLLLAKRDFRFLLNQIKHQSFSQIITEQIASKERLCQVVQRLLCNSIKDCLKGIGALWSIWNTKPKRQKFNCSVWRLITDSHENATEDYFINYLQTNN